jgi:hypothetical protein
MQRTPPEDISPAHIRGGNEGTVEQDPPERENHGVVRIDALTHYRKNVEYYALTH